MAEKIYEAVQTLHPDAEVVLYELDATSLGGDVAYFHGHNQGEPIIWQGVSYTAFPIIATGFGISGDESQARPSLKVADLDRSITLLCEQFQDLLGAKFTRRRTTVRFLDAANFPEGNPDADPSEHMPDEVYFINQKTEQLAGKYVVFDLRSALDLDGVYAPSRPMVSNICQWKVIGGYKGPYCSWTGGQFYDENNNPTSDPAKDVCSGTLSGCKCRFGENNPLPFGSFPATRLVRQ